jgi:outer membrane lipoprotein SlyB
MFMKTFTFNSTVRRFVATIAAVLAVWLPVGAQAQNYSVSPARPATIESIRQVVEHKNSPSNPLGMIAGGLIGGGIGSLFGGGNGRTAATIIGALGGGYIGHNIQNSQTQTVWEIGVKYDNGTWGTIRQTASPPFRIGDRVLVTDQGLEYLR